METKETRPANIVIEGYEISGAMKILAVVDKLNPKEAYDKILLKKMTSSPELTRMLMYGGFGDVRYSNHVLDKKGKIKDFDVVIDGRTIR